MGPHEKEYTLTLPPSVSNVKLLPDKNLIAWSLDGIDGDSKCSHTPSIALERTISTHLMCPCGKWEAAQLDYPLRCVDILRERGVVFTERTLSVEDAACKAYRRATPRIQQAKQNRDKAIRDLKAVEEDALTEIASVVLETERAEIDRIEKMAKEGRPFLREAMLAAAACHKRAIDALLSSSGAGSEIDKEGLRKRIREGFKVVV